MRYRNCVCEECGEFFASNRIDKQFCSGRCKSRDFRRTQREKLNLLERLFAKHVPSNGSAPSKRDLFAA